VLGCICLSVAMAGIIANLVRFATLVRSKFR
jgi:hypothetical protein